MTLKFSMNISFGYGIFVLFVQSDRLNLIERLNVSGRRNTRDKFDFAWRQSGSRRFRSWNSLFVSVSLLRSVYFSFQATMFHITRM